MNARARVILIVVVAAIGITGPVASAPAADRGAAYGAEWLRKHAPRAADGAAADALVALRAGGRLSRADARARAAALRRGARAYARSAGAYAKVIIALRASKVGNPRCAGRIDLLAGMNSKRRRGRYGQTVYDHTLAMLAAQAIGAGPPRAASRVLLRARGSGGWNFRMTTARGGDSVSSTAFAIIALRGAGLSANNSSLRAALRWIGSQRLRSGGYSEAGSALAQANPTALAVRAARAMGRSDRRALRALRSLQRSDGAFVFTRTDAGSRLLATNDAVLALSGRTLPVGGLRRTPKQCG